MIYLLLFWEFFKTGLFAIGGGLATIPFLMNMADKYDWFTRAELSNMIAVSESTPGPIAINCATFVGYKIAGIPGAVVSTLGMVLPSFLIIYLISRGFENFLEVTLVANAFRGIKIAVGLLILDAGWNMAKKAKKTILVRAILVSACVLMLTAGIFSWKLSAICLMITAAVISVLIFVIGDCRKKGGEG